MSKQNAKSKNWIRYYEERNILDEITDETVDLILDEHLRDEILSGKRKRKLKNVTIKIDPLQVSSQRIPCPLVRMKLAVDSVQNKIIVAL